ncbi:MAG TPA: hypothetical protein VLA89_07205, partial [Gemmatimonadales bacterium]|nr:hypothetical protein [Gemmatimonadales bacterium]
IRCTLFTVARAELAGDAGLSPAGGEPAARGRKATSVQMPAADSEGTTMPISGCARSLSVR